MIVTLVMGVYSILILLIAINIVNDVNEWIDVVQFWIQFIQEYVLCDSHLVIVKHLLILIVIFRTLQMILCLFHFMFEPYEKVLELDQEIPSYLLYFLDIDILYLVTHQFFDLKSQGNDFFILGFQYSVFLE